MMNERMYELINQAFIGTTDGKLSDLNTVVNVEKFAELIIKECATKLRETDYELVFVEDGMCDPSISDAMLVAASDIEEYFGVE